METQNTQPPEKSNDRGQETLLWLLGIGDQDYPLGFGHRPAKSTDSALRILGFLCPPDRQGRGLFACDAEGKSLKRMWFTREIAELTGLSRAVVTYHVTTDPEISPAWRLLRELLVSDTRDELLAAALGNEITAGQLTAITRYLGMYDREAKQRVDTETKGSLQIEAAIVSFPQNPASMGLGRNGATGG